MRTSARAFCEKHSEKKYVIYPLYLYILLPGVRIKRVAIFLTATLCISYSATIYCSLQSIHNTFISFVALNELPQHGQIYFLVLDGFLVLGAIGVPFPLVPPVINNKGVDKGQGSANAYILHLIEKDLDIDMIKGMTDLKDSD